MSEIFSALIALTEGLLIAVQALNAKKEKKLARNIMQIHFSIQTIIDDAFKIYEFINNAASNIDEYGESQYSHIIKDNLHGQTIKIRQLSLLLQNPDISPILRNLNRKHIRDIWHMFGEKGTAIYGVMYRIGDASLKIIEGKLYAVKGRKKDIAFPNIKKQYELLNRLQNTSGELSRLVLDKIKFRDLL